MNSSLPITDKGMPTLTKSLIQTEEKYEILIIRDLKTFFPSENENVII